MPSTIGEILARHVPNLGTTVAAVPVEAQRRLSDDEQNELWRERAVRRHRARVPGPFANAHLDAATLPEVKAWAQAYISGTAGAKHSLLLAGRVGRGKTWLAYAALAAIADAGIRDAAWAGGTVAEVFARMRPNSGEDRATVFRELTEIPVLLLDDLGAAKSTDWTEDTFLDLLDTRVRRDRPLIVTTNATPTELRGAIGDRALSRLIGMCVDVQVEGPDRRLA